MEETESFAGCEIPREGRDSAAGAVRVCEGAEPDPPQELDLGRDVSVIVVSHNTRDVLRDCLNSLRQHNGRCEVIVVDNDSRDGTPEMVADEFPQVTLLRNSSNDGFSRANNRGMAAAHRRFLLLLNDDTVVQPGAIAAMERVLKERSQAGAVTCKLLNRDGSIQASVGSRPGPMLLLYRLSGLSHLFRSEGVRRRLLRVFGAFLGKTVHGYLSPYAEPREPVEVGNISGACLMLRREAVEQVGPLDEDFFMYQEDMDYCVRLLDAGWKLLYVPSHAIVHLGGISSGGRMRDYSVHSYRSLLRFYRKHYSSAVVLWVRLLVLGSLTLRWLGNWIGSWFSRRELYRRNMADLRQVIGAWLEG